GAHEEGKGARGQQPAQERRQGRAPHLQAHERRCLRAVPVPRHAVRRTQGTGHAAPPSHGRADAVQEPPPDDSRSGMARVPESLREPDEAHTARDPGAVAAAAGHPRGLTRDRAAPGEEDEPQSHQADEGPRTARFSARDGRTRGRRRSAAPRDERPVARWRLLRAQLGELDTQIAALVELCPEAERLMTVPEIGTLCAATIVAELGTPDSYEHPAQVLKLAGMNL